MVLIGFIPKCVPMGIFHGTGGARPNGTRPRAVWGSWGGAATSSQPAILHGERHVPSGFGADPRPPKGFTLFSALRMASPDTNGLILLIVEYHAAIGGKITH